MDLWYPKAERKPLGSQTENRITPRIFVVHTMVGHLRGTDSMFRRNGYHGTESHFGIGCPTDAGLDGDVWQWQRLDYSADAQGAGNAYCTSIETADGGKPESAWSDKQLAALIDLGTWWARQVGAPAKLVTSTSQKGFGFHRQFKTWNPNNHSCPGNTRLRQYLRVVIPAIGDNLNGNRNGNLNGPKTAGRPSLSRVLRERVTGQDVRQVQHLVSVRLDNDYGPKTSEAVKTWQAKKKTTPDGVFGPVSCRAAGWTWKG